jgi:hypothetical protein
MLISLAAAIVLLYAGAGTGEIKRTEGIQPGNLAPAFRQQGFDLTEKEYVLVQFWAAYDPQSRLENARMYHAIARSGIERLRMVSISLDESRAVVRGVIRSDGLDETTLQQETDGRRSALFKSYRLKNGFGNYLLDSQGVIVAKNLSPQEVAEQISF